MRFHQNMNKLSIRSYNRGFEAPSTALFNTELGKCEMTAIEEEIDELDIITMPDFLEVLVEVIPIPFDDTSLMATYHYFNETYPSVPLYNPEKKHFVKGLNFKFADVMKVKMPFERESFLVKGNTFDGWHLHGDCAGEDFLAQFLFDYYTRSLSMTFDEKKEILTWPYGGFYKPGCKLQDIQQVFFTLEERNKQTHVYCSLLTEWHNEGKFPPGSYVHNDKKIIFKTSREHQYIYFVDAVRQGDLTVSLTSSLERSKGLSQSYKSIDIIAHGINKFFIHFMRN